MVELKDIPVINRLLPKSIKEVDIGPVIVIPEKSIKEAETKEGKAFIARSGNVLLTSSFDDEPQKVKNIDMYFNAYRNFPLVSSAIDVTVEQTVQDFRIDGPQKDSLDKWANFINLKHHLSRICKHGLIGGTHWAEKVELTNLSKKGLRRLKKPFSFKHLDSRNMKILRSNKGKLKAHIQTINRKKLFWGEKPKDMKGNKVGNLDQMFCWKWNLVADDKYGTSIIHSSLPMLDIKDRIESDLRVIAQRYLSPTIHARAGNDLHPADETELGALQGELEDIYSDTEYVTNHLIEMNVLDMKNKGVDFKPILNHIDSNILAGLQTQVILLASEVGGTSVSDKGSEVKLRANNRHIKSLQSELAKVIEEQVFFPMTGTYNNKLVFENVEERQFETDVEIINSLVTNGVLTPKKANSLLPDQYHDNDVTNQPINVMRGEGAQKVPFDNKVKGNPNDPTKTTNTVSNRRINKDQKLNPKPAKKEAK